MTHNTQAHLSDDQISTVLDGTGDESFKEHIVMCSDCQKRIEEARRIEAALYQQLFRQDCPPSHKLTDYFNGLSMDGELSDIADHVSKCVRCREELESLARFMAQDETQHSANAKKGRVIRPPANYFVAHIEPNQTLRQVRGTNRGKGKHQIRAKVEGIVVMLDFQTVASGIAVEGVLIDDELRDWAGSLVEFRKEDTLDITCPVDELGTFGCHLASDGCYQLRITTPFGGTIIVPDIVIDI